MVDFPGNFVKVFHYLLVGDLLANPGHHLLDTPLDLDLVTDLTYLFFGIFTECLEFSLNFSQLLLAVLEIRVHRIEAILELFDILTELLLQLIVELGETLVYRSCIRWWLHTLSTVFDVLSNLLLHGQCDRSECLFELIIHLVLRNLVEDIIKDLFDLSLIESLLQFIKRCGEVFLQSLKFGVYISRNFLL